MDREAQWATVNGVANIEYDLETEQHHHAAQICTRLFLSTKQHFLRPFGSPQKIFALTTLIVITWKLTFYFKFGQAMSQVRS